MLPSPTIAAQTISEMAALADVVLATFEDEEALFGDPHLRDTALRYRALGAAEVVVKVGTEGAFVLLGDELLRVPAVTVSPVVDTTAPETFSVAPTLPPAQPELPPLDAATLAAAVAATVVSHASAIVPSTLIPETALAQRQGQQRIGLGHSEGGVPVQEGGARPSPVVAGSSEPGSSVGGSVDGSASGSVSLSVVGGPAAMSSSGSKESGIRGVSSSGIAVSCGRRDQALAASEMKSLASAHTPKPIRRLEFCPDL